MLFLYFITKTWRIILSLKYLCTGKFNELQ